MVNYIYLYINYKFLDDKEIYVVKLKKKKEA